MQLVWWKNFNSKISRHWLVQQGNTKTLYRCVYEMMIDLWEMRKEEVYWKEEITKRQIGKEKAATRVWDLHKLQEIARPSNAKLFYADVYKQIETSTTATLEGFVAMKIETIHNSVKQ